MKGLFLLLLLFSLLSALAVAASTPRNKTPKLFVHFSPSKRRNLSPPSRSETQYYRQNLDHFSFAPLPDFDQRYLIGSFKGWSRNGPIFFYCGNEGDIEWFAANTGLVWEMAPQFSALVVFAEHRYYGESMPYGSKERAYKDAKSMSYLTTEQALADFSTLLIDLKRNLSSEDSPVLLFGGSYGGRKALCSYKDTSSTFLN